MLIFYTYDNYFDILLVVVCFHQTCYDICFFGTVSLHLFLLQIILYIYFLLLLLIFIFYFHYNLLLFLVSQVCFFDNKSLHLLFIHSEKNYSVPVFEYQRNRYHNMSDEKKTTTKGISKKLLYV